MILVGEYTEVARLHAEADAGGDVLLGRFEPSITLSLLEDMMKNGIVRVVIHIDSKGARK